MARTWAFPILLTAHGLLSSCSIVDVPVSTASGSGLASGASLAISADRDPNEKRVERVLETELARVGYRIEPSAQFVVEFGFARRPSNVGILLPEADVNQPEAGTWRSRPIDHGAIELCKASIYRLMIVVTHRESRQILFRGSSDDDVCGDLSDQKLKTMVAVVVAQMRQRSMK